MIASDGLLYWTSAVSRFGWVTSFSFKTFITQKFVGATTQQAFKLELQPKYSVVLLILIPYKHSTGSNVLLTNKWFSKQVNAAAIRNKEHRFA
ncbi:hypothetical protein O181_111589 [Austropuccinia psidii MF-1]|uniref:Uncharacterized protein n=1 Tax=Austropuccinia psidii MF-1 TaxID=1389203 RepID=A0A9Q3K0D0_9BASI|nr:hypothetical protein [Austropuccinia psidii MF-1]